MCIQSLGAFVLRSRASPRAADEDEDEDEKG